MNNHRDDPAVILVAEDDEDDFLLLRDAMAGFGLDRGLVRVENGEELLDYLFRRGRYADPAAAPRPDMVLLDLNMPRVDGLEALAEIKADPRLKRIPVVVLTTSSAREDILCAYDLGVNSFIRKPDRFSGFVKIAESFGAYWFDTVELPAHPG